MSADPKPAHDVLLVCPRCGREQDYDAKDEPGLPIVVEKIVSLCPECCGGDFGSETWFNCQGDEVAFNDDGDVVIIR